MSDDASTLSEKNLAINLYAFIAKHDMPRDKSHALSNMMLDIRVGPNIVFFAASLNLKLFSEELLLIIEIVGFRDLFSLSLFNVNESSVF